MIFGRQQIDKDSPQHAGGMSVKERSVKSLGSIVAGGRHCVSAYLRESVVFATVIVQGNEKHLCAYQIKNPLSFSGEMQTALDHYLHSENIVG